jgi:hypothetical protein
MCQVAYWPSTTTRYASWEGTMKPVHLRTDGSLFQLDDNVMVMSNGKTVTNANKLIGYILAKYIDGNDAKPTRSDCIDRYAFHALEKHQTFLLKTYPQVQQAPPKKPTPKAQSAAPKPPRPSRQQTRS